MKLTNPIDLAQLPNETDFEVLLNDNLVTRNLTFLLKFPPDEIVSLYMLHVKRPNSKWENTLDYILTSSDGEIDVNLGEFKIGESIKIRYGISPAVGKVKLLITAIKADKIIKLNQFKDLEADEKCEATDDYTVQ